MNEYKNKNILILLAIAAVVVAMIIFAFQFSAPQKIASEERVVMNLNTSQKQFIDNLEKQGYIKSAWAFNIVLQLKNQKVYSISPGSFLISKNMNAFQIADQLANHPYQRWVVIPEGLRKEEIAEKVGRVLTWNSSQKADFLAVGKEGYLFPDTYLFDVNSGGNDIAKKMENNFNTKVSPLFSEAMKKNIRNDTVIILASLVQREAANEKEMPVIAEIIWNRLDAKMPLQIDASIQYALGNPNEWWGTVGLSDYKIDSPFNLYTHNGKPPLSICNPGLSAINAIVNSASGDYLYYLHDENGQIHLAKTYAEHRANIAKYLK